ncbi:DUF237 domain-containing protein [Mycoplasmoides pneumoniae]
MKTLHKLLLGLFLPAILGPLFGLLVTKTDAESPVAALHKSKSFSKNLDSFRALFVGEDIEEQLAKVQQQTPEVSFASFQQKFPDKASLRNGFQPIDVYNFLSGWKGALENFLAKVVELQKKIKAADDIFPNQKKNPDKKDNPNVLEVLGEYGGDGFFPTLGNNGLNIPDQVFQSFNNFQIENYKISDFKVDIASERDIVQHDKFRFSYVVNIGLELALLVNKRPVYFNFSLDLRTNNFSNQAGFNEIFNAPGNAAINWQFFSKVKVKQLNYDGNDSTHLANTLLQDQFNTLNLNLQKSIYELPLTEMETKFQQEYVELLLAKRREEKRLWDEEQKRIEAERKQKEAELARIQRELKEKAEKDATVKQAQTNLKTALSSVEGFVKFWTEGEDRIKLGFTKEDNLYTRAGLVKALKISFANYRAWTFYITLLGWKAGSEKLLRKTSWTNLLSDVNFQNAFGLKNTASEEQVGKTSLPGYGYYGIRMSNWLRWALGYYANTHVGSPQNVKATIDGNPSDTTKVWIAPEDFKQGVHIGVGEHFKGKAYKFKFEVSFELEGSIAAHWWTLALRGNIPGYWKGKLQVTHTFDGDVPSWYYGSVHTHAPEYRFTEDNKLLFVPHSIQKITAVGGDSNGVNGLLKSQNLHNLERQSYEVTAPIDLVSYLMFAIAKEPTNNW